MSVLPPRPETHGIVPASSQMPASSQEPEASIHSETLTEIPTSEARMLMAADPTTPTDTGITVVGVFP